MRPSQHSVSAAPNHHFSVSWRLPANRRPRAELHGLRVVLSSHNGDLETDLVGATKSLSSHQNVSDSHRVAGY
jgi:hypothetical protein